MSRIPQMLGAPPARPPGPPPARLAARLLGPCLITLDGQVVDTTTSRRTRSVLAYLVTHRRAVSLPDVLMEAFWPGAPPEAARNRLHVSLSGVRAALRTASPAAGAVVVRRQGGYGLHPRLEVWLDAEGFEQLCRSGHLAEEAGDEDAARRAFQAADQLYDGDLLACDPYAEWAAPLRDFLRLHLLDAQTRLLALQLRAGETVQAGLLARRMLAADPCHEPAHRALMTCYAATGLGHLALLQYHRCAEALWRGYRVAPSAETSGLWEALRRPRTHPSGAAAHASVSRS